MSSQIFTYSAVQIQQSDSAPAVVLFAAPCTEMALWAGIPQKKKFGETTDEETVGFQRQENKVRVNELMQFYSDSRNVIQNPILCASRSIGEDGVYFRPLEGQPPGIAIHGEIIINLPNFDSISMAELFGLVRQQLERRVSDLAEKKPSSKR